MAQHTYRDYAEYQTVQIEGNRRKQTVVWVREVNIAILSKYIQNNMPDPKSGICHGTRNGREQQWFRKYLGIDVIGTEISPLGLQYPNTIQWDFHDTKPEWIGAVDFVYSNSLDHAYDPQRAVDAWMACLKPAGLCFVEWSRYHQKSTRLDPYGATLEEYHALFSARYDVVETLLGDGGMHLIVSRRRGAADVQAR